jgi:MFS transporter, SHS family, lactate transporter
MLGMISSMNIPITNRERWHAVMAGFLGWTMDAFDFFVVVFMLGLLAAEFHVSKERIVATLFLTLAMRPIGALLFGMLSDRYGRRRPLMANVVFFSVVGLLCGFAPNFTVFLILRALYGIGMGGEWGVGASLAMESAPPRLRGVLSGILQSGYSIGYLLAAVAARFVLPTWGWRPMFWLGGLPALLALYIRSHVRESEAWEQHRAPSMGAITKIVLRDWKRFAYLVLLMTLFMFLSHGTQDLYPDFLETVHHATDTQKANIAMIYNVGAVVGAILFGLWSERLGRRKAIVAALMLSLAIIYPWSFGTGFVVLTISAFVMQMGVQGAWGIIPAHLNELSADAVRGTVPGFAYQLGILFASGVNSIEHRLSKSFGYSRALLTFELVNIVLLAIVVMIGPEEHGRPFVLAKK